MAISRVAGDTGAQAIDRVRRYLGDPDENASGVAIPEALRRWSDNAILATLNEVYTEMGTEAALVTESEALLYEDTTYTEGDDNEGMRLPSAVGANAIYAVEDITSPNYPIRFPYVSPLEINDYVDLSGDGSSGGSAYRFYSLLADSSAIAAPPHRIKIRPSATGRSIRIWYVAPPLNVGVAADTSPLDARWNATVAVAAAVKLLAIDEELPPSLASVHTIEQARWKAFASRQQGPERIRLARWRSC